MALTGSVLAGEEHAKVALNFIDSYCLECHDDIVQKGERNFYDLDFPITDEKGIIAVQQIIDALNLGNMPPKEADQPSDCLLYTSPSPRDLP